MTKGLQRGSLFAADGPGFRPAAGKFCRGVAGKRCGTFRKKRQHFSRKVAGLFPESAAAGSRRRCILFLYCRFVFRKGQEGRNVFAMLEREERYVFCAKFAI